MEIIEPSLVGAKQPLIQGFKIEGLYGYRTIGIKSNHAASIVIARNGSGKSTLLAAMDAFLRCQFGRLAELEFTQISCKLKGIRKRIYLKKEWIERLSTSAHSEDVLRIARRADISPTELVTYIESEYDEFGTYEELNTNRIYSALMQISGYSLKETTALIQDIRAAYYKAVPQLANLRELLTKHLEGVEIVYLPTYRRIELPLAKKSEIVQQHVPARSNLLKYRSRDCSQGEFSSGWLISPPA